MQVHETPEEAVEALQGCRGVFIHGGGATPQALVRGMVAQAELFEGLEILHLHTEGPAAYAKPQYADNFRVMNLFVGHNVRSSVDYDHVDYVPVFLSEVPRLLRDGHRVADACLIHVSPPDQHGYCSLGVSVDVVLAALEVAQVVIAQINPQMPRVHGDGFIHVSRIHHAVHVDEPLPEARFGGASQEELEVGRHVANIVDDGSTLQAGIGAIPDAVLRALTGHRHLGVHTEMWSDGMLDLLDCGAVDNSRKKIHPGKTISAFLLGTRRLYDFVHDNPSVQNLDVTYVNRPDVISRNPKVVAINSAVAIDLTGQVCADSVGHRMVSGVGGQMDFLRGAAISPGGKPIIAVTSRSKKGFPKIVNTLSPGSGVVTTRAHVHWVATEYGIVNLFGRSLRERARLLISLAHPEDREGLEKAWRETHGG